jgi:hypothetical protein
LGEGRVTDSQAEDGQMRAYLLLAGGFLAITFAQTLLNPGQLANVPQLPSQFGFNCTSVGTSTNCELDKAYMLHILPVPFDGTSIAPSPGACFDSGGVIVTNEPAAYFCVRTSAGAPGLNWIRVAGVNSW